MGLFIHDIIFDNAIFLNSFFINIQNGLYKLWRSLIFFADYVCTWIGLVLAVVALDCGVVNYFFIYYYMGERFRFDLSIKKWNALEVVNNKNINEYK
jgi:hypothetical protein